MILEQFMSAPSLKVISSLRFLTWQSCDTLANVKNRKKIENLKLDAGGKPSTLFPPGGLVELLKFSFKIKDFN